jgi:hypothetical protein
MTSPAPEGSTWGTVEDCPCGKPHTLSGDAWDSYRRITAGKPPTVMLTVAARSWLVPRIWIAVHGIRGREIPALAARYGWEEVLTRE